MFFKKKQTKKENRRTLVEGERMLTKVKAVLTLDVSFQTHLGVTHLDAGTEIVLEPEENIGYYDGYHFDLKKEEYKIAYLN